MKNVLITGTSSGIGRAVAEHLAAGGHRVVGTARRPDDAERETIPTFPLDVRDDVSVAHLVARFSEEVGRVDVLVNNAGYGLAGPIEETTIEEARAQFETNFFGVVRMTRAVLPLMRKAGGGLIVNVGSMAGLIGLPFQGFYAAAKFALEGFTEALRLEVRPFGIRVVNVDPADCRTPFTANRRRIANLTDTYRADFERTVAIYERDERSGADPLVVARCIRRLVETDRGHRIRYVVGKRAQTIGAPVKRVIGADAFERVMRWMYKLH